MTSSHPPVTHRQVGTMYRPAVSIAAPLAAVVLLTGSSCDTVEQSSPEAGESPAPRYTEVPRSVATRLQGLTETSAPGQRLYNLFAPQILVDRDGTSAFEDRALPPCESEPYLLPNDPYTSDVAFSLTLERNGRYLVARQVSVYDPPRAVEGVYDQLTWYTPQSCEEALGSAVRDFDQTAHLDFASVDRKENAELEVEPFGDESGLSSGQLTTRAGDRVTWVQISTRLDNLVALTHVVDLRSPAEGKKYDYTRFRPGDSGWNDRELVDYTVAEAAELVAAIDPGQDSPRSDHR